MPEPYRAAIYYAPERDDPLWQAGCTWLGFDPETATELAQPNISDLATMTSSPRRYGFHATLKPPMRLAHGYKNFIRDAEHLAASLQRFTMPALAVKNLAGFLAICTEQPATELDRLAKTCVLELDTHRLPEDVARQDARAVGRTATQIQNIADFGYPYVLDDWQFHMTLSNQGAQHLLPAAAQYFAAVLQLPRVIESLAIFIEPHAGARFQLAARLPLGG